MPISHPLKPWQKMVLGDYAGSMGFNLDDFPDDIDAVCAGDTLIQFILTELDETEDCHDYAEAMRRMEVMEADLLEWSQTLRFAAAVQGDDENDQAA